ncbi:MAG TPA: hypothetical protein VIY47_01265 [Ignavibacteriaceae bacterium]
MKEHRISHKVDTSFIKLKQALKSTCVIYRKSYKEKMETLEQAFQNDKNDMMNLLKYELANKRTLKASIIYHAEFLKSVPTEDDHEAVGEYVVCLRSKNMELSNESEIAPFISTARESAQNRIDDFLDRGK